MKKLRLAYVRFTSCSGCQLMLLNCEEQLAAIDGIVEVVAFDMASSRPDDEGGLDVVLIEGSISRPEELVALLKLRRRSEILVAVGACALTGGVNALAGGDRIALCEDVYGECARDKMTFAPQPLSRFVRVDMQIAGCPPERSEYLRLLGSLACGTAGIRGVHGMPPAGKSLPADRSATALSGAGDAGRLQRSLPEFWRHLRGVPGAGR